MHKRPLARRALWPSVAVALCAMGCSQVARVTERDQRVWEGKIVGGSPGTIFLEDEQEVFEVRRRDIARIEHPGDLGVTGAVEMLLSLVFLVPCLDNRISCSPAATLGLTGLATAIWSGAFVLGSKRAAADTSRPSKLRLRADVFPVSAAARAPMDSAPPAAAPAW